MQSMRWAIPGHEHEYYLPAWWRAFTNSAACPPISGNGFSPINSASPSSSKVTTLVAYGRGLPYWSVMRKIKRVISAPSA